MEGREKTCVSNSHISSGQHEPNIHESSVAADCSTTLLKSGKQNFDFGAEIIEKQIIARMSEREIKTNCENITTATESTMSMATSIPTLDCNSNSNENCLDNRDDADSYQSTNDDEEEMDRSENLQATCGIRANIDATQISDESSSDSDFSDLSGLSEMSGREWKPINSRPITWVQKQIHAGANPRTLLSQMLPANAHDIAPGVNDMMLWRILASMLSEPPRRQKLSFINTFEDVLLLIQQSRNIIVLTGAGVSVSCGIPDFRSSDGIYSRLAKDFPNLPDPQAMFDINYFQRDPRPFYKFAREIYPGQFKPSPCHRFIKLLEQKGKLLRNYTQNIDTLEQVAGINNVIECHGSFSTASCTKCKVKCSADVIRDDIFAQRIPVCPLCQPFVQQSVTASEPVSEMELRQIVENGIMKPDIVFFGEGLPEEFHTVMASDKDLCDLLIVIGSSLKVRPVALIPSSIPANVPQILINREQLHHLEFDVELLGDSDVIINQLCHRLGEDWKKICFDDTVLKESKELVSIDKDVSEGDEEANQMLDADTQSVKSIASVDLVFRSAGTYSDSGFESSTSSGTVVAKTLSTVNEANETIEQIKSSIMEFNSPSKTKRKELTTHELLEEPSDAVDFDNRNFHSFTTGIGTETSFNMNSRHLSVDSSKDSGIQCEISNSAVLMNGTSNLPPPEMKFSNSSGTSELHASNKRESNIVSTNLTLQSESPTSPFIPQSESNVMKQSSSAVRKLCRKPQTTAERLFEGTYYCHESSSSYVFPGAQVSWWSDTEGDNDDDVEKNTDEDEDDVDANGSPLSPLMPPSVEAEVVSEISTASAFAVCTKRPIPAVNKGAEPEASCTEISNGSTWEKLNTNGKNDRINDDILSPKRAMSQDDGTTPPQKKNRCAVVECASESIGLTNLEEVATIGDSSTSNEYELFHQTLSRAVTNETPAILQ